MQKPAFPRALMQSLPGICGSLLIRQALPFQLDLQEYYDLLLGVLE